MPESQTAYHEAGHCVMAVMLGGVVEVATIVPDLDELPKRYGDVRVRWNSPPGWKKQVLVALAGPAAEMVFRQEPLHPGFVQEWSEDWKIAWELSNQPATNERKRVLLLEQISQELYQVFGRDDVWNSAAAIADELLAHETIYQEQIDEIIKFWIR
jgi:hypothetical protein